MDAKTASEEMRQRAKDRFHALFNIPGGFSSGLIDEIVDCVIEAAVLEVAAMQQEALYK